MQSKRLIKKTGLYFIGNMSSKILTTLLIPIYAFYISVNDLGYYDYTQTIMGIIIPIIFMAIWESILRFLLLEENEQKKSEIITTSVLFSFVMTLISILVIIFFQLFNFQEIKSMPLIIIMFISYAFTQIWQYYSRALGENKVYAISGIVGTAINFVSVVFFICVLNLGLNGLFISYILGQIVIFIYIEKKIHILQKFHLKNFDFKVLKTLLFFSLPLVLNLTSMWLITGFGRIIITTTLGTEANGLFSFAIKFSMIVIMIGSVVTMAVIEEAIISAKTVGFDSRFSKTVEAIFKIFQSMALLMIPLITLFYTFIQDTDYFSSLNFAIWLLLFAIATTMSSTIGSVFQAIDKTKYQFITSVIGGIVTVVISVALISTIEVYAVILGQILGSISVLVSRYILINKFVMFKIGWIKIINNTVVFIVVTLLSLYLYDYVIFNFILFIFITSLLSYINRKYLKLGFKFMQSKFEK